MFQTESWIIQNVAEAWRNITHLLANPCVSTCSYVNPAGSAPNRRDEFMFTVTLTIDK